MSESVYGTPEERAARGAKELDRVKPEWPTLMRLETFHDTFHNDGVAGSRNTDGCVLERVYGRWSVAPLPFSEGGYIKYGMNVTLRDRAEDEARLLAAWRKETLKRLEVANV